MAGRVLATPAPWGLAIVLGIQTDWDVARPIQAGEILEISHGPNSAHNFGAVLAWIESEHWRAYRQRLMDAIPWTAPLAGAEILGTVRVTACLPPDAQRNCHRITLTDPRPAWIQPNPPAGGRAAGAAIPTSAPHRPAAGPLFERG